MDDVPGPATRKPPAQPPRFPDPRRWLLLAAIAVVAAAWFLAPNSHSRQGAGLRCLVHGDCAKALRCYAVPAADGFATHGVCVETCVDDEQCRAGYRCATTAQGSEQLNPVAAGKSPGERVCLPDRRPDGGP